MTVLNLKHLPLDIQVTGVGIIIADTFGFCDLTLSSHFDDKKEFAFTALVLNQLTLPLPMKEICRADWRHFKKLQLVDHNFLKPKQIDCILGTDVYAKVVLKGVQKGESDDLIAQDTLLGRIVTGLTYP